MHNSLRTEEEYVYRVQTFIRFHGMRLPAMFLYYGKVLGQQLPWLKKISHPKLRRRRPMVLTVAEVRQVLRANVGEDQLLARLLHGCGLWIIDALQLRVRDGDSASAR